MMNDFLFFKRLPGTKMVSLAVFSFLLVGLEQTSFARSAHPAVPRSWVKLPEERHSVQSGILGNIDSQESEAFEEDLELPSPDLDRAIGNIVKSTANTANRSLPVPQTGDESLFINYLNTGETRDHLARPSDWVPWHLEFFSTQLSLTTQGLVGLTTVKVQPSVTLNWRRQGTQPPLPGLDLALSSGGADDAGVQSSNPQGSASGGTGLPVPVEKDPQVIEADPSMTDAQILAEFEPALKSAIATGRIRDPGLFLKQTQALLLELRNAALAVNEPPGSDWWVSGVRFDFSVDAVGKLLPFFSLGAEVRFRFEWRRVMPTQSQPAAVERAGRQWASTQRLGQVIGFSPLADSLNRISQGLLEDIRFVADDSNGPRGFQAQAFRVGLGISAKGEFGISKVGTTAIAHLNFTRDISRPIVYPVQMMSVTNDEDLPLLETDPQEDSLTFASRQGIKTELLSPTALSWGAPQVLYRVPRAKFRKGLRRALAMGRHLARATQVISHRSTWKIYELKAGVDLSMTGALGLATVGGIAMGEISFWNEEF